MARGIELEPEARRTYNTLTGHQVEPACIQSNTRDWMRCSLDGICFDSGVAVEIKCGYSAYRSTAKRQKVPRHYSGQVQHTRAVTGFDRMHFFCYLPGQRPVMVDCERDDRYIAKLIEREERFWNSLDRA
jgi:putative phage-type endonuclease